MAEKEKKQHKHPDVEAAQKILVKLTPDSTFTQKIKYN
jgi:hypothetical protein